MIPLARPKWIPLDVELPAYQELVTSVPGFYRVWATGRDWLVYIGQERRRCESRFNRGPTVNSLTKRWVQMVKADFFGRTKATLRDLFRGDECFDFVIRRSWWATAIISEKLPSGLFF